jgi:pimeloyl-ACP methyl ester carboxylesterase
VLWFLLPGVAEHVLPAEDWAYFRQWGWDGVPPGTDADTDRQIADLSRPGENRPGIPHMSCPTMGVWSSGDFALSAAQMTGSERYVDGPWRYERIEGVDHWVPVHAPDRLNRLLLDFLSPA